MYPELELMLRFAEETARSAGALLRDAYYQPVSITNKSKIDLVTQADHESEALIVSAIKARYPNHGILAEESGSIVVDHPEASELIWIIDPLDGTTNFAHKFPVFSVSIAVRDASDLLIGVIYDPLRDECFSAARGTGAFLNGAPIRVSAMGTLDESLLATGFPYTSHTAEDNNTGAFSVFARKAQGIRRAGSAALDMAYVACGRFDGYWELIVQPWDVAAGIVIVREAGGRVSDYTGDEDTFRMMDARRTVTTNGLIHEAMIETLHELYPHI
jgi:myo-inositol-1(or 4)-monophosphatase